jgi:ribosome-binding factor A
VGRRTGVKFTPTLSFVADWVPAQAGQIEELLAAARAADAAVAEVRLGAQPAGEADPYRLVGGNEDERDDDPQPGLRPDGVPGTGPVDPTPPRL